MKKLCVLAYMLMSCITGIKGAGAGGKSSTPSTPQTPMHEVAAKMTEKMAKMRAQIKELMLPETSSTPPTGAAHEGSSTSAFVPPPAIFPVQPLHLPASPAQPSEPLIVRAAASAAPITAQQPAQPPASDQDCKTYSATHTAATTAQAVPHTATTSTANTAAAKQANKQLLIPTTGEPTPTAPSVKPGVPLVRIQSTLVQAALPAPRPAAHAAAPALRRDSSAPNSPKDTSDDSASSSAASSAASSAQASPAPAQTTIKVPSWGNAIFGFGAVSPESTTRGKDQ